MAKTEVIVAIFDSIDDTINLHRCDPRTEGPILLDRSATSRELDDEIQRMFGEDPKDTLEEDKWEITGRAEIESVTLITFRSDRNHLSTIQIIW